MLKTMLSSSWRRALVLSSLLALILPTLSLATPTQAATDWQREVSVSNPDATSGEPGAYEPSVAIDNNGCTHIAWFGGPTQDKWRVYYSTNRDHSNGTCRGTFGKPKRISSDSGEYQGVDIAVSSDGHVHVVASRREGTAEINYMESTDHGLTWPIDQGKNPRNISNSSGSAFEPSVAVDSDSNVYFAWIDNRDGDYITYYTLRVGGVYGETDNVSRSTFDKAPEIVVTGSATNRVVHFTFSGRPQRDKNESASEILYVNGTVVPSPAGAGRYQLSLGAIIPLTADKNAWAINPSITTDGSNLYLVYEWTNGSSREIYLTSSPTFGASWTVARNVTANTPAGTGARYPNVSYGLSFNRPTVTIGWDEGPPPYSLTNVYAIEYYPDNNTFEQSIALLNRAASDSDQVIIAGNPLVNRIAAVFQGRSGSSNLQVFASTRGSTLTAVPLINSGAERTNNPALSVTLTEANGSPTQMRYAVDRNPTDGDAWVPFQSSFSVTVPDSTLCERTVFVQVRNAQGAASAVASDKIVVDTVVSASVSLSNPGIGDPAYTQVLSANVRIQPDRECSTLTVQSPMGLTADGFGGFKGSISLADNGDRPRDVKIIVEDSAGNRRDFDQVITVDRGAPTLNGGKLQAPSGALPALQTDLVASDFGVTDTIYASGYWGVQVANTLNFSATDNTLNWQTFQLRADNSGDLTVKGWSVASGLGQRPTAGTPIQVRLRFIDGAGNPSSALTTTVSLAAGFSDLEGRVPLLLK